MSETYNNIPMTEAQAERVAKVDAAWTGPKLIVLALLTLGASFALLWASAEGIIGPEQHEMRWAHEAHILQGGCAARPWD